MAVEITLTNGAVALVDEEDAPLARRYSWNHIAGYAGRKINGHTVYLHELIVQPGAGLEVDHLNRNKLDNRRGNLRAATHSENLLNREAPPNRAGFRGVEMDPRKPEGFARYRAVIHRGGERVGLGCYRTAEEAAAVAEAARSVLIGPLIGALLSSLPAWVGHVRWG